MSVALTARLFRLLRKPPSYIAQRAIHEARQEADRWLIPLLHRGRDSRWLLRSLGCASIDDLWRQLLSRPYPFLAQPISREVYDQLTGGDSDRVVSAAHRALDHQVDLMGSGLIDLGRRIRWNRDYKTDTDFPDGFFRDIDYARLGEPCDVKFPWELSRVQWLIPAAQAYVLTGDEQYAASAREILEQWIEANPYAHTVNWACTMEAALRIFSWTYLFRAFGASRAWADRDFRGRFLTRLYLHAEFTERYIERADVVGNHFTADAAALVVAGLFFGSGSAARRWAKSGWDELTRELPRQVYEDGVDFEASVPYHRLVQELFLFSVLYRRACGLEVPMDFAARVNRMAWFTAAYSRANGSSPVWGDNDDARVLPLGDQDLRDHRYLVQLSAHTFQDRELANSVSGSIVELLWIFGPEVAKAYLESRSAPPELESKAFPQGGVFIMRNERDHVFVDCGHLGLAGRGGHGHNDLLSFDAQLDGVPVISDSGCYLYTASVEERNNFRSTSYHSTPMVDGEEINRFIRPDFLWNLHEDARPTVHSWRTSLKQDEVVASHDGFTRLAEPVTVTRRIVLSHGQHQLSVHDQFDGAGAHALSVPFHFDPLVQIEPEQDSALALCVSGREFLLTWSCSTAWSVRVEQGRWAPRYGVVLQRPVVRFVCEAPLPQSLHVTIAPRARLSRGK